MESSESIIISEGPTPLLTAINEINSITYKCRIISLIFLENKENFDWIRIMYQDVATDIFKARTVQ